LVGTLFKIELNLVLKEEMMLRGGVISDVISSSDLDDDSGSDAISIDSGEEFVPKYGAASASDHSEDLELFTESSGKESESSNDFYSPKKIFKQKKTQTKTSMNNIKNQDLVGDDYTESEEEETKKKKTTKKKVKKENTNIKEEKPKKKSKVKQPVEWIGNPVSESFDQTGRRYYNSCKFNGIEVTVGEVVYLPTTTPHSPFQVCKVESLFENWKGEQVFCGRWLYRYHHLKLILTGEDFNVMCRDHQELFYSDDVDENYITNIKGKCVVFFLRSRDDFEKIEKVREKRDIFYCKSKLVARNDGQIGLFELDQCDLQHTFDHLEKNVQFLFDQFRKPPKITALEIFAGCGGLSLGLQKAGIQVKYSIEFWQPAAETHQNYFPDHHTFCKDAEEFLKHIKVVNELKKKFGLLDDDYKQKKKQSSRMKIHIKTAKRKKDGSLWLLIEKGNSSRWEDVDDLDEYHAEVVEFLETKYASIPKPNEIDLIAGGPPCQGFSTLNRHKERDANKFLSHDKNRLVLVFLDYVKYFKPKYAMIENVTGILHTAVLDVPKAIIGKLNSRGYDVEIGCLNSLQYGVSTHYA